MPKYAQVIVDIAHTQVDRLFAYAIPQAMDIDIGQRVLVPFGRGNALKEGYVVELQDEVDIEPHRVKTIARKAEGFSALLPDQVALALWMKEQYHCLLVDALRLMIPAQMRGNRVHEKTVGVARLAVDRAQAQAALQTMVGQGGGRKAPVQARLMDMLLQVGAMALSDLYAFFPGAQSAMAALIKKQLVIVNQQAVRRTPYKDMDTGSDDRPELSNAQQQALDTLNGLPPGGSVLLFGVTGSGKTEVYLRAIERVLSQGKSAIVLVPEISLTPQTVARFRNRLGDLVAVMHSQLSAGERYDEWRRVREEQARVVIGPRSALFAPVSDLGLIVIDEEHEQSYVSEQRPSYHAHEVADKRAALSGGVVMLGSATPLLETYEQCVHKKRALAAMPERFGRFGMPKVRLIDMRQEMQQGNRTIFSGVLYEGIKQALDAKEQVMLLINRRGYSTFLMCRGCGYVFKCPHCDVSMTYHVSGQRQRLSCHYCGQRQQVPKLCPECQQPYLKFFGIGTQQVEEQVQKEFPQARILRMDHDTTQTKDAHLNILSAFGAHEADILIGTQMIAKGLDFANVTLVGVMAADASLFMPDYRSAERTFSLIMQVAGRAGRDQLQGRVVVQCYNPDHYAIQAAVRQDYLAFFREECQYRQASLYPPYARFLQWSLSAPKAPQCEAALRACEQRVRDCLTSMDYVPLELEVGAAPLSRIKEQTRMRLLLKLGMDERVDAVCDALYQAFDGVAFEGCSCVMTTNPLNMS